MSPQSIELFYEETLGPEWTEFIKKLDLEMAQRAVESEYLNSWLSDYRPGVLKGLVSALQDKMNELTDEALLLNLSVLFVQVSDNINLVIGFGYFEYVFDLHANLLRDVNVDPNAPLKFTIV